MAQRGTRAETENTLEALGLAIGARADAVSVDVRVTADGHPVLMRDAEISHTTDGSGFVHEMTLGELRAVRVPLRSGGTAQIPHLVEALRMLSGMIAVNIEIRNLPGDPGFDGGHELAIGGVLRALDETSFAGGVLISSFSPFAIGRAKALAPHLSTAVRVVPDAGPVAGWAFASEHQHPWVLATAASVVDAGSGFPGLVHASATRLGVWGSDDPGIAAGLVRRGVDAIVTDDPAPVVAALRGSVGAPQPGRGAA